MTSNILVSSKAMNISNPPQTFRARDNLLDRMRGKKVSLCENLHPILIKSDDFKSASTNTHGPVKISRLRHQKNISEVCKKGIQLESVSHVPKIGFNAAVFLDSKILESP